ncbi:MAG TPA: iron-sulfur cluster assembly protein [Candidatus Dormibacteraeota bacterium]|jgi:metal-sulfur cluster biosynthetic enzyme|nr:iron-sulfur cluster assembly protein [Candidatus Dormibacteraeota bacterium]
MRQRQELESDVEAALQTVIDPELDRSLSELGFARAVVAPGGDVTIELRLPTYWCAPNFVFLMAQDARDAVEAVPGVRSVRIELPDHFATEEITGGLARRRSFDQAFPKLSDGSGLHPLRRMFWAKGFMVWQERLARRLLAAGRSVGELATMRLGEVDHRDPDLPGYLARRARLSISTAPTAPLVVYPNGQPVDRARLMSYLDRCRLVAVSLSANAELCQSLHATRFAPPPPTEIARTNVTTEAKP